MLAERHAAGAWRTSFEAEVNEIQIASERVLLVAPQTFMNLSGRSVRGVRDFYKLPLSALILICDELNLPCGKIRLRGSGSAGGQKGLQNTIDQLGSSDFARLRIGVGRPPSGFSATNYVLQKFAKSEFSVMQESVSRAASAVECWITDGIESAMNQFNRASDEPESSA